MHSGNLKKNIIEGAAWMVAMRAVVNVLGLLSIAILARLLTPEDFGIVALAGSAYAFFSVLGQLGFDSALIQKKELEPEHYSSAWTANILVGVVIAIMTVAIAGPAARFFDDVRIEKVIYAFAVLSLAKGFENIGVVNFRKSLKFKGDFLYFVIPKVSSVIVGVGAAYFLRNYWALVIGAISMQITALAYSHFSQPFRPRLTLTRFSELFVFSKWIMVTNFLVYLSTNGIDVALGKIRDATAVGVYGLAKQIAFLPSSELLAPINRALFPGFASVSDNRERLHSMLSRVLSVSALVAIPASFGIIALSESLVATVLGPKWSEVASVLDVLGYAGLVAAVRGTLGPVLLARGRPEVFTFANLLLVLTVLPLVILLAPDKGATGVAMAYLVGVIVTSPVLVSATYGEIGFGWKDLLRCAWRPLVAGGVMLLALRSAQEWLLASGDIAAHFVMLGLGLAGAILFTMVILALWLLVGRPRGAEREILDQLVKRFGIASKPVAR